MGRRSIVQRELLPSAIPGGLPSGVGALGNWVFIYDNIANQTQTNNPATGVPVLAACIQLKYSGTVRVSCSSWFNSATAARTMTHQLIARQFSNVTTRFTAGTGVTVTSNNVALGHDVAPAPADQTPQNWAAALAGDSTGLAAHAINFNGVQISAVALNFGRNTVISIAGALTAQASGQWTFSYNGMVPNLNNSIPDQHWPISGDVNSFLVVALMLLPTNAGDVVSYAASSLTIQEQPLP
jgi:hypothetical protein